MKNKIIRNFLAKQAAGRSDDGIMITLRDPQKIELLENIMAELLMRNGIDPRAITSESQLKLIVNQIEAFEKKNLADNISSGIRNTESAKIFEIATGKEIPKGSKIMGGKELKDKFKHLPNVKYAKSIEEAIKSIDINQGDLLLITGSLYLCSEVLNLN